MEKGGGVIWKDVEPRMTLIVQIKTDLLKDAKIIVNQVPPSGGGGGYPGILVIYFSICFI
jgi:hypothetical protein